MTQPLTLADFLTVLESRLKKRWTSVSSEPGAYQAGQMAELESIIALARHQLEPARASEPVEGSA